MRRGMKKLSVFTLISFALLLFGSVPKLFAQEGTAIECGDIIEGEFTDDYQEHRYLINLAHGDQLAVSGRSLERTGLLRLAIVLYWPDGKWMDDTGVPALEAPYIESNLLDTRGTYTIKVVNSNLTNFGQPGGSKGGVGKYALYIGCTLRDGTIVEPGSSRPEAIPTSTPFIPISTYGFPGIPPIDFSSTVEIPVVLGQPFNGALSDSGQNVFAFTYGATAGSTNTLTVNRLSGNLSIGIVVINKADNDIIFLAGMPSTNSFSAEIVFPVEGAYTIGVFRLDIAPNHIGTSGAFEIRLN